MNWKKATPNTAANHILHICSTRIVQIILKKPQREIIYKDRYLMNKVIKILKKITDIHYNNDMI